MKLYIIMIRTMFSGCVKVEVAVLDSRPAPKPTLQQQEQLTKFCVALTNF